MSYMVSPTDRFNSSYKVVNDCFVWQKYLDKDGYGTFYFKKKSRKAHRFSYYITHGDIPTGMMIDHICRNRACVNPEHLRLVTPQQNTLENSKSIGAINKAKTHCKLGHPLNKINGVKKPQRYCSICENEKSKRLSRKWLDDANKIMC